MKNLQLLSKYLIWFSIIGIPILWFILLQSQLMWANFLGSTPQQIIFDLSLLAVFFVMIIRPLADIFPSKKILRKLVFLRKSLGIFSAMVIVTIMISGWIQNPDISFLNYFSKDRWRIGYPIISRISEITAVILLITSNNLSMKKLGKNWKKIQKLSYPYFFAWAIVAARWSHTEIIYIMIAIVIILWIAAKIKKTA